MGHRYYTKENIKEFQQIKELKDQGYQLRAIRMILHNGKMEPLDPPLDSSQEPYALSPEERMAQFRELMSDIVGQAIANNNEALSEQIGKDVQERVLKEMNYLMREQDQLQEERYQKLDAAIRGSIRKKSFLGKLGKKEEQKKKLSQT